MAASLLSSGFAVAAASDAESAPGPFTLGAGASDWSGDYGSDTTTNIAAVLLTGRYRLGDLRLSASVPWMRIDSQSSVFAGVDGTPLVVASGPQSSRRLREGWGDVTLGASYLVETPPAWGLDVDTFARVKLPTSADSTGLSTGQTDASLGVEVSKPFGRFVPFVSVGYRHFGDTPLLRLNDGVAASLGASYLLANHITLLASYDYAERASPLIQDAHDISASVSAPIPNSKLRVTGFAAAGLSSGAADVSGGLSLSLQL